jgi:predicted amidohydrolase
MNRNTVLKLVAGAFFNTLVVMMKIAIASPPYPHSLDEGLNWVEMLAKKASEGKAEMICFPESYLPGYPLEDEKRELCTKEQLEQAFKKVCAVAARHSIAIIIPMDWYIDGGFYNVAHVISKTGTSLGIQTKNQLDPSEDLIWQAGTERRIFEINGLKFGISICHEGFRYPETVRWAARRGAVIVFHPNLTGSNKRGKKANSWGHHENPYYEKAQMVRALENTIYFAPSNYSLRFSQSASSVIAPDGSCVTYHKDEEPGIIIADIDQDASTGLLSQRLRAELYTD